MSHVEYLEMNKYAKKKSRAIKRGIEISKEK